MKIIFLAAAGIVTGVLMQKVYESSDGLTLNDMTQMVSDGTQSVTDAAESVESATRKAGSVASATTDAAARTFDTVSTATTSGMKAVNGALSAVKSSFSDRANSPSTPSPAMAPVQRADGTSMPSKPSAMNIKPFAPPPIEREPADGL